MEKKNKKFFFIQDWGTFSNETLVCVGMTHNEIVGVLRQIKAKIEIARSFIQDHDKFENFSGLDRVWYDRGLGATILSLKDWSNDWKHWDCLVHESTHLVHEILGHQKNMMDEDEARAYQIEYLFREIRRKLWDKKHWEILKEKYAKTLKIRV